MQAGSVERGVRNHRRTVHRRTDARASSPSLHVPLFLAIVAAWRENSPFPVSSHEASRLGARPGRPDGLSTKTPDCLSPSRQERQGGRGPGQKKPCSRPTGARGRQIVQSKTSPAAGVEGEWPQTRTRPRAGAASVPSRRDVSCRPGAWSVESGTTDAPSTDAPTHGRPRPLCMSPSSWRSWRLGERLPLFPSLPQSPAAVTPPWAGGTSRRRCGRRCARPAGCSRCRPTRWRCGRCCRRGRG